MRAWLVFAAFLLAACGALLFGLWGVAEALGFAGAFPILVGDASGGSIEVAVLKAGTLLAGRIAALVGGPPLLASAALVALSGRAWGAKGRRRNQ